MTPETDRAGWTVAAILAGRLIFTLVFTMAVTFKLIDHAGTATYIAAAGFPRPISWPGSLPCSSSPSSPVS